MAKVKGRDCCSSGAVKNRDRAKKKNKDTIIRIVPITERNFALKNICNHTIDIEDQMDKKIAILTIFPNGNIGIVASLNRHVTVAHTNLE